LPPFSHHSSSSHHFLPLSLYPVLLYVVKHAHAVTCMKMSHFSLSSICKFCITFCIFKIKSNNSLRFSQTCLRGHLDLAVTCSKRPN
jgi:hypothetical protein